MASVQKQAGAWTFTGEVGGKRGVGKFLLFVDLHVQEDALDVLKLAVRPLPGVELPDAWLRECVSRRAIGGPSEGLQARHQARGHR